MTSRLEVALVLREIGQLLQVLGESPFRARAYLRGASALEGLEGDLSRLLAEGRLTDIPGIGNALAAQIAEIADTGRSAFLTSLRSRLPPGTLELRRVTGLSLRRITLLHEALGIASVDDLRSACEAGRVRTVKGFGQKTERKILDAMVASSERARKALLHQASTWAQDLLEHVRGSPFVVRAEIAGELRRAVETIGEIDLVAASSEPAAALEDFLRSPYVARSLERGPRRTTVMLAQGLPATYGVVMARRGWVRRGEVLNARPVDAFVRAVRPVAG